MARHKNSEKAIEKLLNQVATLEEKVKAGKIQIKELQNEIKERVAEAKESYREKLEEVKESSYALGMANSDRKINDLHKIISEAMMNFVKQNSHAKPVKTAKKKKMKTEMKRRGRPVKMQKNRRRSQKEDMNTLDSINPALESIELV